MSTTPTADNTAQPNTAQPSIALPTLRLCTAGSVDDGKSTFVGRLLHDTKSILADQYESVERASAAKGLTNPDLSLLVDGLRAEREQGITIDVAYRYFATDRRSFILADTPGHVQYTRNTVTGMSTSELVIVLVDVRNGVTEQTRRHLTVAAMMEIAHVIVAVNKIDALDYDEAAFRSVAADITALASELGLPHVDVVPTSALVGDNIVERSTRTPWYGGPSVLEILETATPGPSAQRARDARLPIQTVIRDHATDFRGYAGRIKSGRLSVGDTIQAVSVTNSHTREAVISAIHGPSGPQDSAGRDESVTVVLDRQIDLSRGDLIAGGEAPALRDTIRARVVHLSDTEVPARAVLHLRSGTATVRAQIDSPLALNDIRDVTLRLATPLPLEPYRRGGRVGSFLLIHPSTGDTLTAGLVLADADSASDATGGAQSEFETEL